MEMVAIIWSIIYWFVAVAFGIYVLSHIWALVVVALTFIFKEAWTVDPSNPRSTDRVSGFTKRDGFLREVDAIELLLVTSTGGKPLYPVIQESSNRLIAKGLIEEPAGMSRAKISDWEIVEHSANQKLPAFVQSSWGFISPFYVLRWLMFKIFGLHVVRLWFPFYFWGFMTLVKPRIMKFLRAKPKGVELHKGQSIIGVVPEDSAEVVMVQDETDHMLYEFPLRLISPSLPTGSGLSFRLDATITFRVTNIQLLANYTEWSAQLYARYNAACSAYMRPRKLEEAYTTVAAATTVTTTYKNITDDPRPDAQLTFQELTLRYLMDGKKHPFGKTDRSVCEAMGLMALMVSINDLVPADADTEKRVVEILSIVPEGERRADVAGQLVQKPREALKGADPAVLQALAAIAPTLTRSGGQTPRVDYIINQNQGGGGGSDDMAMRALLTKLLRETQDQKKDDRT